MSIYCPSGPAMLPALPSAAVAVEALGSAAGSGGLIGMSQ